MSTSASRPRAHARPPGARPPRRWRALTAVTVALACLTVSAAPSGAAVPVGTIQTGIAATLVAPRVVPGANNWFCRPSAAHPRPVVLVHGTLEAPALNWAALAPTLKNEGYCVFALTYGENLLSLNGRFPGLTDIRDSAGELRRFVDLVRFATGASKVDLVGHSQGA
jgi:triacylglycerol esterase/lipase EstA (alpha/beta hydrolase family)